MNRTAASRLRELADELHRLDNTDQPTHAVQDGKSLFPVPAADVEVGDVISDEVGCYLTVEDISEKVFDSGHVMLQFKGRYDHQGTVWRAPYTIGAFPNEWVVVVER